MTVAEKVDIVHKVLVEHELQKDVAREYRVRPLVVHFIIKKAQRIPDFLLELVAERDRKEEYRQ